MTTDGSGRHTVRDHERELTFEGVLLGRATSRRPGKRRWSEVIVYRTNAGTYVVAGVGGSDVRAGEDIWDERTRTWSVAPQDEATRYWANLAATADGVVQSLYLHDANDTRYLTKVAREALREASGADDALRRAFMVEEVA